MIFVMLLIFLMTGVAFWGSRKGKRRRRRPRAAVPDDSDLVAKLQVLAAECKDGSVQALVSAGRRTKPNQMEIITLDQPELAGAFLSARATIDKIRYGFHAYPHPRANSYSRYWLYFSVTGPGRERGGHGEFQITDEFRWTGGRPFNPALVKFALREWVGRPEVQEAIARAEQMLPKPVKRQPEEG